MLSSHQRTSVFADKENTVALSSRKATMSQSSRQAGGFKTPNARAQTKRDATRSIAGSVLGNPGKAAAPDRKAKVAATVGLEAGARVLVAKDGNNRTAQANRLLTGRVQDKGKGRADSAYDECCLVPHFTSGNEPTKQSQPATRQEQTNSSTDASQSKSPSAVILNLPAKTPARRGHSPATGSQQAFLSRTPAPGLGTAKKVSPGQTSLLPSFSAFKTPSPNQLLRRRKAAGSPVPLHFNPTSLRSDDVAEEPELAPAKPTVLERLQAQHALIDDTEEVDIATRQAVPAEDLPVDLPFEMPSYGAMDLLGISFRAWSMFQRGEEVDEPIPVDSDDDLDARYTLIEEPEEWPIFFQAVPPSPRAIFEKEPRRGLSQPAKAPLTRVRVAASQTLSSSDFGKFAGLKTRTPRLLPSAMRPAACSTQGLSSAARQDAKVTKTVIRPDNDHYVDFALKLDDWKI